MRTVWNQLMRDELYLELVSAFGTFESWGNPSASHPPGRDVEWNQFLTKMSLRLSQLSGKVISTDAVWMQIKWAISNQTEVSPTQSYTWMMNKAAARNANFIGRSQMPKIVLAEF